jgi:hypothetical protein
MSRTSAALSSAWFRVASLADWSGWSRSRRVAELLIVLWTIGLTDLWLTLWAHRHTAFVELNPIAARMLSTDATGALVAFKLTCMLVATLALWLARHTRRCELAAWGMAAIYFALLLRWSDYTAGALGH